MQEIYIIVAERKLTGLREILGVYVEQHMADDDRVLRVARDHTFRYLAGVLRDHEEHWIVLHPEPIMPPTMRPYLQNREKYKQLRDKWSINLLASKRHELKTRGMSDGDIVFALQWRESDAFEYYVETHVLVPATSALTTTLTTATSMVS